MKSITDIQDTNTVNCKCCNVPMTVQAQVFPKRTLHLITCWNRNCKLYAVTQTVENYDNLDLATWNTFPGECVEK